MSKTFIFHGLNKVQGVIFIDQASEKKYKHLWTQQRKAAPQKSCGPVPLRSNMELKNRFFMEETVIPERIIGASKLDIVEDKSYPLLSWRVLRDP